MQNYLEKISKKYNINSKEIETKINDLKLNKNLSIRDIKKLDWNDSKDRVFWAFWYLNLAYDFFLKAWDMIHDYLMRNKITWFIMKVLGIALKPIVWSYKFIKLILAIISFLRLFFLIGGSLAYFTLDTQEIYGIFYALYKTYLIYLPFIKEWFINKLLDILFKVNDYLELDSIEKLKVKEKPTEFVDEKLIKNLPQLKVEEEVPFYKDKWFYIYAGGIIAAGLLIYYRVDIYNYFSGSGGSASIAPDDIEITRPETPKPEAPKPEAPKPESFKAKIIRPNVEDSEAQKTANAFLASAIETDSEDGFKDPGPSSKGWNPTHPSEEHKSEYDKYFRDANGIEHKEFIPASSAVKGKRKKSRKTFQS